MMHRKSRSKRLAITLAAVVGPLATITPFMVPTNAHAAPEVVKQAQCNVHAVFVSKDGDGGIPAELRFLEEQLRDDTFAAYKRFELIEQKALELSLDKKSEAAFRSGNRLGLRLLGNDQSRLKLNVELSSRDGKKSILGAVYSMLDGGVLMIHAGAHTHKGTSGKLFFAIQCARGPKPIRP